MANTTGLDEETASKVLRQVEFYFGDSNLPRDNFLMNTLNDCEDGMVDLALICSFTRMRTHLDLGNMKADQIPLATVDAVSETLRSSGFLKLSEDGRRVGRSVQLNKPEEVIEQVDGRTIAASPVPYDANIDEIKSFFAQYAKVNSCRLPRHVSHKFYICGTALVEFSTEEDAEKVLKQTLSYAGADLELKPKKDFDLEREKDVKEFEEINGKDSEKSRYPKGLILAFTLKSKLLEEDSKQNGSDEHASEAEVSKTNGGESVANGSEEADKASVNDKNGAVENVEETMEEVCPESIEKEEKETEGDKKSSESADKKDRDKAAPGGKSAIESYKNNMDVVIREDLKAVFGKFGTVKYIDFKMGETSGYVRFEEPEGTQKARAAAVLAEEGGLVVKNYIATLEPVSGNEEKEYWSQILGSQGRIRDNRGGHKGRGGRHHNRGGRHGRSRDRDQPAGRANKVQKVAT
ncbi:hypothetical protein BVRB_2g031890 [Beta vulgaris subsp. vulgaris]|uniref:La protein 1 n=1 Tax=Beta vulgaris subsp. vulgaris TaxID=3555 RepID=A0A0J8CWP6_BETVV|nr:hypothetical protein BVRB_2g031890 [Beta vulgaris subsp. vulgaris]